MQKTMLLITMMLMMMLMKDEKKKEEKEEDMLREKSNNPNLKGGTISKKSNLNKPQIPEKPSKHVIWFAYTIL